MGKPITTIAEWQEKYAAHKSLENKAIFDNHVISRILSEKYTVAGFDNESELTNEKWSRLANLVSVAVAENGEMIWFIDEQCIGVYNPDNGHYQVGNLRSMCVISHHLGIYVELTSEDDNFLLADTLQYNPKEHDKYIMASTYINAHSYDGRVYLLMVYDLFGLPLDTASSFLKGSITHPVVEVYNNNTRNYVTCGLVYDPINHTFTPSVKTPFNILILDITDSTEGELNNLIGLNARVGQSIVPDLSTVLNYKQGLVATDKPYYMFCKEKSIVYLNLDKLSQYKISNKPE